MDKFRLDTPSRGVPEITRSDCGDGLQNRFTELCHRRRTKQEFTTTDIPRFREYFDRGLMMLGLAQLAACVLADSWFGDVEIAGLTDSL